MDVLDIVGICGSLRRDSFNRMALELVREAMPASMRLEVVEWREIPPYDGDVFAQGFPAPVAALRERLRRAHGIVIATPEYNFSIPGVLKNVIDWVSRGADQPFALKPVAILSASPGALGGARVQYDLRKSLLFLNAMMLQKPEVFIANAAARFDARGRCADAATRTIVAAQMAAFEKWIHDVARMQS
jgi:chromate reductase